MASPLEDLYLTRTERNRNGTILGEWNHVLLLRDLDRLVSEGIIDRVKDFRETSLDSRDMTWYRENSTEALYVYVAPCERGAPEFRLIEESATQSQSDTVQ